MSSGAMGWNQRPTGGALSGGGRGLLPTAGASSGSNMFQALAGGAVATTNKQRGRITIKTEAPKEPEKPAKTVVPREKLDADAEMLFKEYFSLNDLEEAVECVKDLKAKAPEDFLPEICEKGIMLALEMKPKDMKMVQDVIVKAVQEKVLPMKSVATAMSNVCGMLEDFVVDIPMAPMMVAGALADFSCRAECELENLLKPVKALKSVTFREKGNSCSLAEKVLGEALGSILKEQGEEKLRELYQSAQIEIQDFFKSDQKGDAHLEEFIQRYGLKALFPMMGVEKEAEAHLRAVKGDDDVAALMEWAKTNVDIKAGRKSESFVRGVVETVLDMAVAKHNEKGELLNEVAMLTRLKPFLQLFLQDNAEAQLWTLFEAQKFAFELKWPKGLLLRLFHHLYEKYDLVAEEAYIAWSEDTADVPGKKKALFELNQFLTWLQNAPEESSDEEEDDGTTETEENDADDKGEEKK